MRVCFYSVPIRCDALNMFIRKYVFASVVLALLLLAAVCFLIMNQQPSRSVTVGGVKIVDCKDILTQAGALKNLVRDGFRLIRDGDVQIEFEDKDGMFLVHEIRVEKTVRNLAGEFVRVDVSFYYDLYGDYILSDIGVWSNNPMNCKFRRFDKGDCSKIDDFIVESVYP